MIGQPMQHGSFALVYDTSVSDVMSVRVVLSTSGCVPCGHLFFWPTG